MYILKKTLMCMHNWPVAATKADDAAVAETIAAMVARAVTLTGTSLLACIALADASANKMTQACNNSFFESVKYICTLCELDQ